MKYRARCPDCGWTGEVHESQRYAKADAAGHHEEHGHRTDWERVDDAPEVDA